MMPNMLWSLVALPLNPYTLAVSFVLAFVLSFTAAVATAYLLFCYTFQVTSFVLALSFSILFHCSLKNHNCLQLFNWNYISWYCYCLPQFITMINLKMLIRHKYFWIRINWYLLFHVEPLVEYYTFYKNWLQGWHLIDHIVFAPTCKVWRDCW